MGKPKDKKKGNIRTLGQPPEKKEEVIQSGTNKKEPQQDCTAVEALIASAGCLLDHPGFVHDGDNSHPLSIAKKTLERFIDRLKAANVAEN